jgi:hypothetical protein
MTYWGNCELRRARSGIRQCFWNFVGSSASFLCVPTRVGPANLMLFLLDGSFSSCFLLLFLDERLLLVYSNPCILVCLNFVPPASCRRFCFTARAFPAVRL